MKKRILLALVVATVLFAAVYASAANITVLGGTIQEGLDTDLTCTDHIQVIGWGLDDKDGLVYSVRFAPLPLACFDADVFAHVYDAGGSELTYGRYYDNVTSPGDNGIVVKLKTPVEAEAISGLRVYVEGAEVVTH